jgi:acetyl/propionyl-CoA carboxylase alpha subunit
MNTRLQVEHPVTEQVTGIDLAAAQIAVAAGEPLPWTQDALSQRGHAIEVRVYAEDPDQEHLPQAGSLLMYREPSGPGIRIDSGVIEGAAIPVHYDPMIAKLIATGESREAARRRAIAALRQFPILGIRTNIPYLIRILDQPRFIAGDIDTHFLETERDTLRAPSDRLIDEINAVAAAAETASAPGSGGSTAADPWQTLRGSRV